MLQAHTNIDRELLVKKFDPVLHARISQILSFRLFDGSGSLQEHVPLNLYWARVVYAKIVDHATDHIYAAGFRSLTVPASGGADSTLVLKILRDACDQVFLKYGRKVKVFGFTLPCTLQSDAQYFDDMGKWACDLYTDDYASVNIGPLHSILMDQLFTLGNTKMNSGRSLLSVHQEISPDYSDKERRVDGGNAAARLRMIFAYGIAKLLGGAPASTDNLSEGLEGFWTLCGDEGTFKYIQGLLKGLEQPQIMFVAGIPSPFIVQKETDGLGVGDGDVSQMFGHLWKGTETYIDVDTVLLNMLAKCRRPDPLNPEVVYDEHPIVQRNLATEFKRKIFTLGRHDIGLASIYGLDFAK